MYPQDPLHLHLSFPFYEKASPLYAQPMLGGAPKESIELYLSALCREIRAAGEAGELAGRRVQSLSFGPGHLNLAGCTAWQHVLRELRNWIDLSGVETRLCFSPKGLKPDDYFRFFSEGCKWLSLDMVSHDAGELEACGAPHSPEDNAKAHILFADMGCKNFDLRLYYPLPGQSQESLLSSARRAVGMFGRHISFIKYPPGAEAGLPPALSALLEAKGFSQYAPGRFGRDGSRIAEYAAPPARQLGFGLGAVSKLDGLHYCNTSDLGLYIPNAHSFERICIRLS